MVFQPEAMFRSPSLERDIRTSQWESTGRGKKGEGWGQELTQ